MKVPKIHLSLLSGLVISLSCGRFLGATPSPESAPTASTSPSASPSPTPALSPSPTPAQPLLEGRDIPDIHGKITLPKEWTLLPGKLLDGDVLLATREKITGENDSWTTGLTMTVDRNGAKDSGQKASAYALTLAEEAREKAGEEASKLIRKENGVFREFRFEFPVAGEQPLLITEILRANDATGTVSTIVWQMPKAEAAPLAPLRDAILEGIVLDPAQ